MNKQHKIEPTSRTYSAQVNRSLKRQAHRLERHLGKAAMMQEIPMDLHPKNYLLVIATLQGGQGYQVIEDRDTAFDCFDQEWCFDGEVRLEEGYFQGREDMPWMVSGSNRELIALSRFDYEGREIRK